MKTHRSAIILIVVVVVMLLALSAPNAGAIISSNPENVEAVSNGSISISGQLNVGVPGVNDSKIGPPPLSSSMDGPPTDIDGDGDYEDLNGNERADFDDVVQYFTFIREPAVTDHVSAYDYNGNGRIDFADLVKLFEEI